MAKIEDFPHLLLLRKVEGVKRGCVKLKFDEFGKFANKSAGGGAFSFFDVYSAKGYCLKVSLYY